MSKKISIIIRTFNEEKWIGLCLEAVFKQSCKDFEIIIIDNNSTDQTVKKAKSYDVNIYTLDDFLPGKSINFGITKSTGEFIVCLSAHCIPVNDSWLSNLLHNFDNDKVAGVYGRQEPMAFTPDTDKRDLITVFGLDKKVQKKDSFFHNANSMIRKNIWDKTPFDEKTTNIEDRLWAKEVLSEGYEIIYEPEARVYHYHGIHQNQNQERCTNVVRILEGLSDIDNQPDQMDLNNLKIVALIPVRGEVLYLNGVPLLEYTIKSAKESKYIQQVIVLTDSEEHAEIARKYGAVVPFLREQSLSEDQVDLEHVYQYSMNKLEEKGVMADIVVTMEITFPFRPEGFIDQLIIRLVNDGQDSIIAARAEFESCWVKDGDSIKRIDEGFIPRKYKDSIYIGIKGLGCATHPVFLREGHLLGQKVGILEISNPYSHVEVRDKMGLHYAEALMGRWDKEFKDLRL